MSKKSILKSGIIGVVIGSIAGILFAPKSGKETRQDIKETATKATIEAEKHLKDVHKQLSEKLEDLAGLTETAKGKAKSELQELSSKSEIIKGKIGETITALHEGDDTNSQAADDIIAEGKKAIESIAKKTAKK